MLCKLPLTHWDKLVVDPVQWPGLQWPQDDWLEDLEKG